MDNQKTTIIFKTGFVPVTESARAIKYSNAEKSICQYGTLIRNC